jgi:predicted lipoprotein with Yx(FWY)xxD motif
MFTTRSLLFPAAAAVFALTGAMALADTGIMTADTSIGEVLTDANGMTLYTFDADSDGMSSCYGGCATNWPPLIAPAGAEPDGDFGLTERKDGAMQWTYYGKPLYTWIKDSAPGDVTGDGVKGVWHAAKPED